MVQMVESSKNERRTAPRADFSGITMLRAGRREIWCKAANVSESGILLYPQGKGALPETPVHVTFTLPSLSSWIELEGRLVRQDKVNRRRAWGVAFDEVPGETQQMLRHFVSRHLTQRKSRPPPLPSIDVPTPMAASEGRSSRNTAPLRKQARNKVSSTELKPVLPDVTSTTSPPPSIRRAQPVRGSIPVVDLSPESSVRDPETRKVPTEEVERMVHQEDEPTRRAGEDETTGLRARCRQPRRS
jgi:PilZ domain